MIVGMKMTRPDDLPTTRTSGAKLSNQRIVGPVGLTRCPPPLYSTPLILIQNHGRILAHHDEANLSSLALLYLP